MSKRLYLILIIVFSLIISSTLQADPQISKEIEKEWFLRDKDPETLKRIKDKGFGEGIGNIEEISAALVMEGYRILRSDTVKAISLFQTAKELSPDFPSAYYATGKAYFKQSVLNIFKTLDEFLSGWKATLRNFWWFFFTMGNLSFTLISSILVSFLIFFILIVIRYFPLLNHDIKERFPNIPPILIKLIPLIFILLFLFSNPGFLWLYILLLILLWPYLSLKERGISLFSLIILSILTLILPFLLLFISVQNNPELKVMVEVNKGWIDDNGLVDLEKRFKNEPKDPEATFSLALAKKRRGNFDEALTLYEKVLDVKYLSDRVYNNLGNIHAANKKFDDAISNYNKAIENNPNLVSAHYNLSQIYRETFRFDEGEKEYQEAQKIDSELLKTYTSIKGPFFNRFVVDEGLSKKEIWRNVLRRSKENIKLADSIWMRFMKWIPRQQTSFLLLLLFLFFLTYSFIVRRRSFVYSCIKCGNIVCGRCQVERHVEDMCAQCYQTLIKMEGSSQKRVEKILEIRKFQDRRKGFIKIMTLFPGIGHLYAGHPIKGIIFIFSVLFSITWWFFWDYLKTPFKIYPSFLGPARLSFFVAFFALYTILLINGKRLLR